MKLRRLILFLALASFSSVGQTGAATTEADFDEIFELLRKNLAGATAAELERAAVRGMINELYPLVSVVTNGPPTVSTNAGVLAATRILEGAYGYLRVGQVAAGVDKEFAAALKRLASTNKLKGLVLDLRFGGGHDYEAAMALADLFFPTRRALIDYGEGTKYASAKTDAISLPMAILINHQTLGAAEALAGVLRRSDVGLLIGTNTAGQANISQEFTLKNGQRLRIATVPVKVADGQVIGRAGLTPDIAVEVSAGEERSYLEDAYRLPPDHLAVSGLLTNPIAGTNRLTRRRISEAELVRMQREGFDLEPEIITGREAGPARPPVITDPALARAIDLLKGLSVVQKFRSF
ncbi:MAG: S41 family peptidase [Verrucomicrobia subdivision 3 bacterium]|nr:S41 family peptidase [Limisphaerales bacterium]